MCKHRVGSALLCIAVLLSVPAAAQPSTTFRDAQGRISGTATTSGTTTTYRDRNGRITGIAERQRDGSVQYRDAQGRLSGSATAPRR
jgi:YD repeat-containing protein